MKTSMPLFVLHAAILGVCGLAAAMPRVHLAKNPDRHTKKIADKFAKMYLGPEKKLITVETENNRTTKESELDFYNAKFPTEKEQDEAAVATIVGHMKNKRVSNWIKVSILALGGNETLEWRGQIRDGEIRVLSGVPKATKPNEKEIPFTLWKFDNSGNSLGDKQYVLIREVD